ncbi:MAG: radical SAM protein [Lachnospiraceae bacterium]
MHYAEYKTILSPKNGINLYRGCTHGCIYCDSRSTCYQMKHEFEDIEVKKDAMRILEQQLRRRKSPCMINTGAMCDPYIPLEKDLQLTRQMLQLIEGYGFGVSLLTKSTLILRDLDLITSINRKTKAVAQLTLTTYDDALCQLIEPHVSVTSERYQALLKFKEQGVPSIVWLGPILPFINDSRENLEGILEYCLKAGVKGILCFDFGVTLREGDREYFYRMLDHSFPGVRQKYEQYYGNSYLCRSPNQKELNAIFTDFCSRYNMLTGMKAIFAYLSELPQSSVQLGLFD